MLSAAGVGATAVVALWLNSHGAVRIEPQRQMRVDGRLQLVHLNRSLRLRWFRLPVISLGYLS